MIGPVKTRNRIIKTANGTSFMEEDQTVGPRMIAYYERLARGGVGFLVVESCGVEYPLAIQHVHYFPDGSYEGVQLHFDDDKFIPSFQRLTEAVHKHGCPVSIQFQHSGPWNPTGLLPRDMKIRDIKCPSALTEEELPGPDFLPCRAMTKQEIEDQIDLWASAAERAYKAGFDACEINHGTCHQGNTFLSRIWNRRDDEYGPQSYENRTRFLRNIITEAKRRCGPTFAVHVLINAAEYNHPLATTLEEGAEMAKLIATVADGLNVRAERYGHRGGLIQPDRILYPEPPEELPPDLDWSRGGKGATVPLVEAVKRKGVTIPVWTACRLDAGDGRGVPAQRQSRLRGHDPPSARRPVSAQQGARGPPRGHPRLHRVPALLRHAQQEQEAGMPGERHPGPGAGARVPVRPCKDEEEGAGGRWRPGRHGSRPGGRPARPRGGALRERPPSWGPDARSGHRQGPRDGGPDGFRALPGHAAEEGGGHRPPEQGGDARGGASGETGRPRHRRRSGAHRRSTCLGRPAAPPAARSSRPRDCTANCSLLSSSSPRAAWRDSPTFGCRWARAR